MLFHAIASDLCDASDLNVKSHYAPREREESFLAKSTHIYIYTGVADLARACAQIIRSTLTSFSRARSSLSSVLRGPREQRIRGGGEALCEKARRRVDYVGDILWMRA